MKVLVTGGAGFIGSHLVDALLNKGLEVAVIDNFSTGAKKNLEHHIGTDADLVVYEGDIIDDEYIEDSINGAEYVFHLAAIRSVPKSIDDPVAVNRANITGTLKVLEACRKREVKRVIFAGSSSVYGKGDGPISPYAVTKMAGANYCRAYSEVFGLDTVDLRFFNVFGARQETKGKYAPVIPKFIALALEGKPLPIHGDGRQAKDFTHVDNVVHANILAMEAEETCGKHVDIGCEKPIEVLKIAGKIWGLCQEEDAIEMPVVFEKERKGDVRKSYAYLEHHILDYDPVVDFDTGLAKTVAWYKSEEGQSWVQRKS